MRQPGTPLSPNRVRLPRHPLAAQSVEGTALAMDNGSPVQEPQPCPRGAKVHPPPKSATKESGQPPLRTPSGLDRRARKRRKQRRQKTEKQEAKKKALAQATSVPAHPRGPQEGPAVTAESIEKFKAKIGTSFEDFLKVSALNPPPPPPRASAQFSVTNHCQQAPHCTGVEKPNRERASVANAMEQRRWVSTAVVALAHVPQTRQACGMVGTGNAARRYYARSIARRKRAGVPRSLDARKSWVLPERAARKWPALGTSGSRALVRAWLKHGCPTNYVGTATTAACHRPDRCSSWKACAGASRFWPQ